MKLKIEIDMDNAAFEDEPGLEAGRIIENNLDWIRGVTENCVGMTHSLSDVNGNKVGYVRVTE